MDLSRFPRTKLCNAPTPLDPLKNLSKLLGGPNIFIKRDDMTGLGMGGNKARQLEFYLGEALAQGADTVISTGAIQSNHVCMTAAAAARLGLDCHIQLETRVPGKGADYAKTGNALLDRIFGATIHFFPEGEDENAADEALDTIADDLRKKGKRPYVIHLGMAHPPLGALGYVDAAQELFDQADGMGIVINAVVLASGSASTHAGMLMGIKTLETKEASNAKLYGICVRRDQASQHARVLQRTMDLGKLLGRPGAVSKDDVWVTDDYFWPSYGLPNPEMKEAIILTAREEGILLDPVYTGKSMAGVIGLIRKGFFQNNENVVFLHTGGTAALFAYGDELGKL